MIDAELQRMLRNAQALAGTSIEIKAVGEYPVRARTRVADVAKWQNDGTDRGVTPSQFVERAGVENSDWELSAYQAIDGVLEGDSAALRVLGSEVAADIGDMCDRVKTGRLKRSFRAEISEE